MVQSYESQSEKRIENSLKQVQISYRVERVAIYCFFHSHSHKQAHAKKNLSDIDVYDSSQAALLEARGNVSLNNLLMLFNSFLVLNYS